MIVVGLTGNFGTGKSTLAKFLKELGAIVIDADKLVHHLLKKNSYIYEEIIKSFGNKVLKNYRKKEISRDKLANIIFSSSKERKKLEAIIHPRLKELLIRKISYFKKRRSIIIVELPLLFEAKFEDILDKIIVVSTKKYNVIERIKDKIEVDRRWKAQLPIEYKMKRADFIINNDASVEDLKEEAKKLYTNLASFKT